MENNTYSWLYEMNLVKDPYVLKTLFKIFSVIVFVLIMFLAVLEVVDGTLDGGTLMGFIKVYIMILGILILLLLIGYYLVFIPVHGGKYFILFTITPKSVTHAVEEKTMKKARRLGKITLLAGALSGNPTAAGAGLLSASRNTMVTQFKSVTKIIALKKKNRIVLVDSHVARNVVFTTDDNYDEVFNRIVSYCKDSVPKIIK